MMHNYWVDKGYCKPLDFDITKFYLRSKDSQKYFSEKFFEKLIEHSPLLFLGEDFAFIDKPIYLEKLIPDALFTSKDGDYIIVEIQKQWLDRTHAYKILEYRDKLQKYFEDNNENKNIRMIVVVIGEECPIDRQSFLQKYGIELKMLPLEKVEKLLLKLIGIH